MRATNSVANKGAHESVSRIVSGAFDVFTMETALPKIDLAQLESHLLAAAKREDHRVSVQLKFHARRECKLRAGAAVHDNSATGTMILSRKKM
jgi:hypothetical protein